MCLVIGPSFSSYESEDKKNNVKALQLIAGNN